MARILVIEDSALIRKEILTILRLEGHDAIGAENGADGIELARKYEPDLILCDVDLPSINGYDTLVAIRKDPETASIAFIFLIDHVAHEDIRHALYLGADDFISKPISETELVTVVNNRLNRQAAIMARFEADLQEARQAQEIVQTQLTELQRAISTNVSHELRTAVGSVIQTLDLLLRDRFGNSPQMRRIHLQKALINTKRILSLIEDLIALKDIDQDKINTFRQSIDLLFDFRRPIQECIQRWQNRQLEVRVNIAPNVAVYAPKLGFRHVITHLVDNACKFSPEGGRVEINLFANGEGGCLLTVRDQGPGIPPHLRERVFDRFYQISQGDNRAHDGLGVGLTIARSFARALGGDVQIVCDEQGCQVELTLPHATADWTVAA